MAHLFKMVSELDASNMEQAIKVRLIRCYALHAGDDVSNVYSLECVFHDATGARIHGSIKRVLIPKMKEILREEHLFAIKNFVLINNTMRVKTCISDYRMIFTPRTNVVEVFDANFPRFVYDFKTYDDLSLWDNIDEDLLIDVIGVLSSRSGLQTREVLGKETTMMDITLKNLQDNAIPCTLWGNYADELFKYVENHTEGPIVVIMQMCRIRKFRGQLGLSNTFKVSKVLFNANVPEIADFQRGLVQEGNFEVPVTNVIVPIPISIRDDLQMNRTKILTVNRLIRINEIDQFWVFCQIVGIEPMFDWWYVSCKRCLKKMAPCGSTFYCVNCDLANPVGNPRYKILVRVADNWGVASFILWDKECVDLIGVTAAELQATCAGKGMPRAITRLVGLQALFKVNVKEFSTGVNLGPYPVLKLSTDVSLINEFSNMTNVNNVDIDDRDYPQPMFAPIKPWKVKGVPAEVTIGVKRNLMGEFSGGEEEAGVKVPKNNGKQKIE